MILNYLKIFFINIFKLQRIKMTYRALILAAGQGTRLMPITIDKPKCLVDLFGKSILQRQVDTFIESGITNIHVVAGYLSHKIKNFGFSISINSEYYKTNMVETLFSARSFIEQNGDLIISYGDIIFEQKNLDLLLNSNDEISLMIDKQWKDLWKIRIENLLRMLRHL